MRSALTAVVLLVLVSAAPVRSDEHTPPPREGAAHSVPLNGELIRVYDAPENPFAPGHRGADVAAPEETPVRASADGVVSFSGSVAGNLSVSVDHGSGLITTYSFLGSALARKGDRVSRGQTVGFVGRGHAGSDLPPHVHLAARQDGTYFDPLGLYVGSSYADLLALTG